MSKFVSSILNYSLVLLILCTNSLILFAAPSKKVFVIDTVVENGQSYIVELSGTLNSKDNQRTGTWRLKFKDLSNGTSQIIWKTTYNGKNVEKSTSFYEGGGQKQTYRRTKSMRVKEHGENTRTEYSGPKRITYGHVLRSRLSQQQLFTSVYYRRSYYENGVPYSEGASKLTTVGRGCDAGSTFYKPRGVWIYYAENGHISSIKYRGKRYNSKYYVG